MRVASDWRNEGHGARVSIAGRPASFLVPQCGVVECVTPFLPARGEKPSAERRGVNGSAGIFTEHDFDDMDESRVASAPPPVKLVTSRSLTSPAAWQAPYSTCANSPMP